MTLNPFIRKLLKLSFLKVRWVEFNNRNRELHIGVKPHKNGGLCPHCNRRGKIVKLLARRSWRDIVVYGIPIFFSLSTQRDPMYHSWPFSQTLASFDIG